MVFSNSQIWIGRQGEVRDAFTPGLAYQNSLSQYIKLTAQCNCPSAFLCPYQDWIFLGYATLLVHLHYPCANVLLAAAARTEMWRKGDSPSIQGTLSAPSWGTQKLLSLKGWDRSFILLDCTEASTEAC